MFCAQFNEGPTSSRTGHTLGPQFCHFLLKVHYLLQVSKRKLIEISSPFETPTEVGKVLAVSVYPLHVFNTFLGRPNVRDSKVLDTARVSAIHINIGGRFN